MNVRTDGEADIANAQKPVHARGQTLLGNGSGSQARSTTCTCTVPDVAWQRLGVASTSGGPALLSTGRMQLYISLPDGPPCTPAGVLGSASLPRSSCTWLHSYRRARLCKPSKILNFNNTRDSRVAGCLVLEQIRLMKPT